VETIPLYAADGRILAADVIAPVDLPPFDNSAVDGYAVRLADLQDAASLPVDGRVPAGAPADTPLAAGTARRIFTGAALPPGADTVFMQEDVRQDVLGQDGMGQDGMGQDGAGRDGAGRVHFPPGLRRGANTRPRGEDVVCGAAALPQGRRLRPQDLALAAALGLQQVPVRRPVRVAIFSTGDEIVEPGLPTGPAQRYDSNRILLAVLAARAGAVVRDLGILADRPGVIADALAAAARDADLILTSGGVSAGEEDHVKAAVEAVGRLVFWRLAIKPGRPVAMGQVSGVPFAGLPGNPAAAFITFVHVGRPLIAALSGAAVEAPVPLRVRATFSYRKKPGRREYVRVRLAPGADGEPEAHKHGVEGAGILTSLTETHGLAELGESVTAVTPGDRVSYLPYELLL
jgi:molybdopterin molybdotransferase